METSNIIRKGVLAEEVVVVDGLVGCGKTMISPIISSFSRVEILNYAFEIEFICKLYKLKKISKDATESLIKMFVDHKLYQTMMGRETNFRYNDISSVFNSPKFLTYVKRIFSTGDIEIPNKIKKLKPILNLTTHDILSFSYPLFEALKNRLFLIEVIRHPYYMIIQQALNMERLLNNPRDIQINLNHKNNELPYFAYGWEDLFINSNNIDRAIYTICFSIEKNEKEKINILNNNEHKYLEIPFECFVLDYKDFLNKISINLNSPITSKVINALKKQKVPRKKFSDGLNLNIYKRCGWQPSKKNLSEKEEINLRRDFCIKEGASNKAMDLIEKYSSKYEKKYLNKLI